MYLFEDLARAEKTRIERAKRVCARAVPFDKIKPVNPVMCFDDVGIVASTYAPHNPLDGILETATVDPRKEPDAGVLDPSQTLRYTKKILSWGYSLSIGYGRSEYVSGAQAFFTEDVAIPVLESRPNPDGAWNVWMSLTPFEMWTQHSGVRAATGRVVIGGLGLGWLLHQVQLKPTVKEVVVVELDQRLLDWYGYTLCKKYDKVVDVITEDIWEYGKSRIAPGDRVLVDIWRAHTDAQSDSKLVKLREQAGQIGSKVWAWGSARGPRY